VPYAGADLVISRRVTATFLGMSMLLSLAMLPVAPPDEAVGDAGWIPAVGLGLVGLAVARRLLDSRRDVSFDQLLVVAYAGVAHLFLLQWLAGPLSPYDSFAILWLGAGAVHPPRRAVPHLLVLVAALGLPSLLNAPAPGDVPRLAAQAMLLLGVGAVLIVYLYNSRRERVGLERGVESARRLARSDPLTGLGNRRAFDEAVAVETERVARGLPVSLGLADLDGFKRLNDTFGHLEGDRVLRAVAAALRGSMRREDHGCYRWGGDEFAVLLPGTDADGALTAMERLRQLVSDGVKGPDGEPIRLSFGLTELDSEDSHEHLVARADAALLAAKGQGSAVKLRPGAVA